MDINALKNKINSISLEWLLLIIGVCLVVVGIFVIFTQVLIGKSGRILMEGAPKDSFGAVLIVLGAFLVFLNIYSFKKIKNEKTK